MKSLAIHPSLIIFIAAISTAACFFDSLPHAIAECCLRRGYFLRTLHPSRHFSGFRRAGVQQPVAGSVSHVCGGTLYR